MVIEVGNIKLMGLHGKKYYANKRLGIEQKIEEDIREILNLEQ